tara:strand:- start:881 stop:1339 length:459 start_codon:yes stop_codon:yes gene_type:complete
MNVALNQDFTTFEKDSIFVQYTLTQANGDQGGLDAWDGFGNSTGTISAWWAACKKSTFPSVTTLQAEKAVNWNQISSPTPPVDTNDIFAISNTNNIRVYLNQDDFGAGKLQVDTEYIIQLCLSGNRRQILSFTTAQGVLFVSTSLFTLAGYR